MIFIVLFTGFPRISWNVGAKSKYPKIVKMGLSKKEKENKALQAQQESPASLSIMKSSLTVEGSGLG